MDIADLHITDLNECLSELPEISVMEFFRSRPGDAQFRWTGKDAVDVDGEAVVGPIFVDDRGIEYLVHSKPGTRVTESPVCRVTRPNDTTRVHEMTRSNEVPSDLRKALLDFVADYAAIKMAG